MRITKELVLNTIRAAYGRWPIPEGAILHNDWGSQYTAKAVKELVERLGWKQSLSRVGKPGDNAWSESFFSILKKEIIHWHFHPTRESARQRVFEYIEIYYKRQRKQKRLGYLSPIQLLNRWLDQQLPCVA